MTDRIYSIERALFSWGGMPFLEVGPTSVVRGECVRLVGPNGSGKTTFLKVLNRLLPADPGSILSFAGEALAESRSLRSRCIYVHQHPYLMAGTVARNVAIPCVAKGLGRRETAERTERALAAVGLAGYGRRDRRSLSGGEVQRVALARAIASGADVFLLDEPTSSADSASTAAAEGLVASLKAAGATLIISTHDERFAARAFDRTLEFRNGRMEEIAQ